MVRTRNDGIHLHGKGLAGGINPELLQLEILGG